MRETCKCFGLSGACTQKACWLIMPPFSLVGKLLKEKFDSASKVSFGNKGENIVPEASMKAPTPNDLLYTMDAPTFCEPDPKFGSFGTRGRYCNATSMGTEGCDIMCCSRNYETRVEHEENYCDCVFRWCCSVKCKTCKVRKIVHRCLWKEFQISCKYAVCTRRIYPVMFLRCVLRVDHRLCIVWTNAISSCSLGYIKLKFKKHVLFDTVAMSPKVTCSTFISLSNAEKVLFYQSL